MPIVNKANYVECPSCRKWMHRPSDLKEQPGEIIGLPFSGYQVSLSGNRTVICQECYERADGKQAQSKIVEETQAKLTKYSWPTMDSSPMPDLKLRPQQFDRDMMEAGANAGCVSHQKAEQGVQTHESQIPHIYAAHEFSWVYHQYCNCSRCRSITSQAFNAQKQESARRLAEQAKPLDVPVARAKLDMPNEHEVTRAVVDFNDRDYHTESIAWVLRKFVERRNAKL